LDVPACEVVLQEWATQALSQTERQLMLDSKALRQRVDARHQLRRRQARFCRDSATYLATLEAALLEPALPP
jgi:hypothetical protein